MNEPIQFAKLSGSGNDFVCIDSRDGRFAELLASRPRTERFARELCHRGTGVGADGVIFATDSTEVEGLADIGAKFLEADGSETELCGNGTACFARWALDSGFVTPGESRILTPAGVVRGQVLDAPYVRVCIPTPQELRIDLALEVDGKDWRCDYAVLGIPHCVTYVDDVGAQDVLRWGPLLRHHEHFNPRGVNANFVQVVREGEIAVRTYEFGVEGETLACGTGSAAAAILAAVHFNWPEEFFAGNRPVLVRSRGGDVLRVIFERDGQGVFQDVCLETVVRRIYDGRLHAGLVERALPPREQGEGA